LWPVAHAVDAVRRAAKRTFAVSLLFVMGYLLAWDVVGPVAYLALGMLQILLPAGSAASLQGGALLLVLAGACQLTPFKQACLRKCHSSHGDFASQERMRLGMGFAPLSGGLAQGAYCLGSS
jgi:predicted metal-binding membrane protein